MDKKTSFSQRSRSAGKVSGSTTSVRFDLILTSPKSVSTFLNNCKNYLKLMLKLEEDALREKKKFVETQTNITNCILNGHMLFSSIITGQLKKHETKIVKLSVLLIEFGSLEEGYEQFCKSVEGSKLMSLRANFEKFVKEIRELQNFAITAEWKLLEVVKGSALPYYLSQKSEKKKVDIDKEFQKASTKVSEMVNESEVRYLAINEGCQKYFTNFTTHFYSLLKDLLVLDDYVVESIKQSIEDEIKKVNYTKGQLNKLEFLKPFKQVLNHSKSQIVASRNMYEKKKQITFQSNASSAFFAADDRFKNTSIEQPFNPSRQTTKGKAITFDEAYEAGSRQGGNMAQTQWDRGYKLRERNPKIQLGAGNRPPERNPERNPETLWEIENRSPETVPGPQLENGNHAEDNREESQILPPDLDLLLDFDDGQDLMKF